MDTGLFYTEGAELPLRYDDGHGGAERYGDVACHPTAVGALLAAPVKGRKGHPLSRCRSSAQRRQQAASLRFIFIVLGMSPSDLPVRHEAHCQESAPSATQTPSPEL